MDKSNVLISRVPVLYVQDAVVNQVEHLETTYKGKQIKYTKITCYVFKESEKIEIPVLVFHEKLQEVIKRDVQPGRKLSMFLYMKYFSFEKGPHFTLRMITIGGKVYCRTAGA